MKARSQTTGKGQKPAAQIGAQPGPAEKGELSGKELDGASGGDSFTYGTIGVTYTPQKRV